MRMGLVFHMLLNWCNTLYYVQKQWGQTVIV